MLFISMRETTGGSGGAEKMTPREKTPRGKYAEWEESDIKGGSWRVKEGWRKALTAEQTNYFTHADSFLPCAAHCAFVTHTRVSYPMFSSSLAHAHTKASQ